jgi:hypothetical protein
MSDPVDLEAMTKDDLLAYAQGLGVSPANAGMTKAQLIEGIEAAQDGGVEQLVTTTKTKDFLARNLTNVVPGTSNATDFLGRNVTAGDKDFLGRGLV